MILDALILQSKLFLSSDMDVGIEEVRRIELTSENLQLKEFTSMIGVGGTLNMMIVISYDNDILSHLMDLFMDGEDIEEEERQEILDSTSGEIINTIIGLALPTFPNRGKGVTITPPIAINDASNIKKYKNSKIISADIITKFGNMSISAVFSEDSKKG